MMSMFVFAPREPGVPGSGNNKKASLPASSRIVEPKTVSSEYWSK